MTEEISTYDDLQREMHKALRVQHPEWIQPDGESPICDLYDARFVELLNFFNKAAVSQTSALNRKTRHL